ncbi:MAG: BON domain-containing protein [Acidobacteria bacterium]|nr:BON domain-containing protein [Acidobacteriota bacterium]MBI3282170.1 BON domain-containing protein [Acidobacteriota bacterium]
MLAAALLLQAQQVSDDAIYDQVRLALARDRDLGRGRIDVKVNQGVVELHGSVKTEKARAKAVKVAKKVKGVQRVVNELRVAQSTGKTN